MANAAFGWVVQEHPEFNVVKITDLWQPGVLKSVTNDAEIVVHEIMEYLKKDYPSSKLTDFYWLVESDRDTATEDVPQNIDILNVDVPENIKWHLTDATYEEAIIYIEHCLSQKKGFS